PQPGPLLRAQDRAECGDMSDARAPVVQVEGLSLGLTTGDPVVEDVSFTVGAGQILGLVGESGSGKTTTALALLGYTRPGVSLRSGTIEVGGEQILGCDARTLRSLRGRVVAYVPQDPGGALNPSLRIGEAIMDVLRAHRTGPLPPESVRAALTRVQLGDDPTFPRRYPHQLSGGQQQRVTIATATVCGPPVAVLDEPTTGLDVLTQDRILRELKRLRDAEGMAMVYVSHDLAVVARMADHVVVMYAGRVLEHGPSQDVIERPRHPYTQALVAAIPDLHAPRALRGIAGVTVGGRHGRERQAAVDDVSFAIERGQCVALVGESGSGKSTIGRCIAGLHVPSAGRIAFDGQLLAGAARARTLDQRRRIQIVFQNPFES